MDTSDANQAMALDFRAAPAFDATAEANRARLVGALDQIAAGNFDAFWDIFDPEVTFHEASCLPYGGAHEGIEATKRAYAQLCASFSEMASAMEAVLASRDLCILYQTITFRAAKAGVAASFPVCEVFRFRDGKVIECLLFRCLPDGRRPRGMKQQPASTLRGSGAGAAARLTLPHSGGASG